MTTTRTAIRRDVARGLVDDSQVRASELENADVLDEIARVTREEMNVVVSRITQARRLISSP